MEYADFRWLYVVDAVRFPNSDVMLDDFSVYTRDERGQFTRKARNDGTDWIMADLGRLVLTGPGYQPWNYMLQPDSSDPARRHWSLQVSFKRSPPPVRR